MNVLILPVPTGKIITFDRHNSMSPTTQVVTVPMVAHFSSENLLPTFDAAKTAAAMIAFHGPQDTAARLHRPATSWRKSEFRLFGLVLRANQFPENRPYVEQFVPLAGHVREKLDEAMAHYAAEHARLVRETEFAVRFANVFGTTRTDQANRIYHCLEAHCYTRKSRLADTRMRAMFNLRDLAFYDTKPGRRNACARIVLPLVVEEASAALADLWPLVRPLQHREHLRMLTTGLVPWQRLVEQSRR